MRRILSFLLILGFLFSFAAAEDLPVLETPAPAKIHVSPVPTQEPPLFVDRTQKNAPDMQFRIDTKLLHIWFPDIMNSDEAILIYDDNVYLIDCGSAKMAPRGVELMKRLGITKIEKLFSTHPHYDHLEGLEITNTAAPIDELLIGFKTRKINDTMIEAMTYADHAAIPVTDYEDGDVFTMGDGEVSLTFWLNPFDGKINHINDCSAITLVKYGERRILFTADVDKTGQTTFLKRLPDVDIRAEILKYPHHGKHALIDQFYEKIKPTVAIVTNKNLSKDKDKWGVIPFCSSKRLPIIYTDVTGQYVHCYTDGYTWVVEYVKADDIVPIG